MPAKIVIADDSKLSAHVLKKYLAELGYSLVGEADDGIRAVELARQHRPDLVILDVFMPRMNGYQACGIIQNELGIPAILITSNTENSSLDDIIKSSPSGVVIKPLNKFQLKSTIDLIISEEVHQIDLARYKQIVKNAPMMFSLVGSDYRYILVNDFYCQCFSRPEQEIVGSTIAEVFGEEVFSNLIRPHIDEALSGTVSKYEAWFSFTGTGRKFMSVTYAPYSERRGGVTNGVVVFSTDTTKLKLSEEQLEILSSTDQLTNLDNRRKFLSNLQTEIDRSTRFDKSFALFSIDIDNFKSINDTYGHPVGDRALIHIAEILQTTLRKVDRIGRIGGEEFAVLLPETTAGAVHIVLDRLIAAFNAQPFSTGKNTLPVTVSIGSALFPDDGTTMEELLHSSDTALYEAKRRGKNQYVFFAKPAEPVPAS